MSDSASSTKVVALVQGRAGGRPSVWRALIPIFAALAVYLPTLRHGFVWDDRDLLLRDPWFADAARLIESLNAPLLFSENYFRPLGVLVLGLQARFFNLAPLGFHLVSVLLHALATWLLLRLAMRLRDEQPYAPSWWHDGAIVVALAYALHPALAEGVSFVSAQFDALLTVFLLAALLVDRSVERPVRRALAVGGLFFLATLCKEMAAGFLFVLPCLHLAEGEGAGSWRDRLAPHRSTYVALLIASLTYLAWRGFALGGLLDPSAGGEAGFSLAASFDALARSLMLMLWPMGSLSPIQLPVTSTAELALDTAFLGLVAVAVVALIRRGHRVGWWLAAALVSLLPVSQPWLSVMADDAVTAERFLMFPVALPCLAVATVWPARAQRPLLSLAGMWCGGALLLSLLASSNWRDDLSLWSWATEASPTSAVAWTNLSNAQMARGELAAVESSAARAIALDPSATMAWNNRGMARLSMGRLAEAEADFRAALKSGKGNVKAANNLAIALLGQKRVGAAEKVLREQSLRLDPNDPYAHLILGELLLGRGEPREALVHLTAGLRAVPVSDPTAAKDAKRLIDRARRAIAAP